MKIEKRGSAVIYNDEYILKEEKDLSDLENYLISRDYHGFITILNREERKISIPI